LLEVLDDRVGTRSTLITSQLPPAHWHAYLNDPTLADAILDRVLHAAHKVELTGESLRKTEKSPHEPPRVKSGLPTAPVASGREGPPSPGTVDKPHIGHISRHRDRRFAKA
jgi:hypothetical protein